MKNKKLLNIYMLVFSLLGIVTIIVPIDKILLNNGFSVWLKIIYYATTILLCVALLMIIILSIINMFTDKVDQIKFMEALSVIAFIMVFINLLIYALKPFLSLEWGYALLSCEMFLLCMLSQGVRVFSPIKEYKKAINNMFIKHISKQILKQSLKQKEITKPDESKKETKEETDKKE